MTRILLVVWLITWHQVSHLNRLNLTVLANMPLNSIKMHLNGYQLHDPVLNSIRYFSLRNQIRLHQPTWRIRKPKKILISLEFDRNCRISPNFWVHILEKKGLIWFHKRINVAIPSSSHLTNSLQRSFLWASKQVFLNKRDWRTDKTTAFLSPDSHL